MSWRSLKIFSQSIHSLQIARSSGWAQQLSAFPASNLLQRRNLHQFHLVSRIGRLELPMKESPSLMFSGHISRGKTLNTSKHHHASTSTLGFPTSTSKAEELEILQLFPNRFWHSFAWCSLREHLGSEAWMLYTLHSKSELLQNWCSFTGARWWIFKCFPLVRQSASCLFQLTEKKACASKWILTARKLRFIKSSNGLMTLLQGISMQAAFMQQFNSRMRIKSRSRLQPPKHTKNVLSLLTWNLLVILQRFILKLQVNTHMLILE